MEYRGNIIYNFFSDKKSTVISSLFLNIYFFNNSNRNIKWDDDAMVCSDSNNIFFFYDLKNVREKKSFKSF